jgi:hypothetical protein
MTDREIALEHAGADDKGLVWREVDVLAALAAARAEQHAECVRLMRAQGAGVWAEYLEAHKP